MTPERITLLEHVVARHGCELSPMFYIDSADGEPEPYQEFCFEHAKMVCSWIGRERGRETWIARSWGETDHAYVECAFGGCGRLLRTDGGITSWGVDSALGLTEPEPMKCCVSPEELDLAACAMMPNDPRWETWDKQARRLLRTKPWRKR